MAKGMEVIGEKELIAMFAELPNELGVKILKDINRTGAIEFREAMKNNSPVGSDGIYKSIKISGVKDDKTALLIGPSAYWARFIEFGTKIRKTSGSGPVQFKSADRGTMSPEPFIAPAIESTHAKASKTIFEHMGTRIYKFLKRMNKKLQKE